MFLNLSVAQSFLHSFTNSSQPCNNYQFESIFIIHGLPKLQFSIAQTSQESHNQQNLTAQARAQPPLPATHLRRTTVMPRRIPALPPSKSASSTPIPPSSPFFSLTTAPASIQHTAVPRPSGPCLRRRSPSITHASTSLPASLYISLHRTRERKETELRRERERTGLKKKKNQRENWARAGPERKKEEKKK